MISIPIDVKLNNPNVSYLDNPEVTFLRHFLTLIGMYNLNRIGADRVDLGLPKSTLSAPYLSSFYQCLVLLPELSNLPPSQAPASQSGTNTQSLQPRQASASQLGTTTQSLQP